MNRKLHEDSYSKLIPWALPRRWKTSYGRTHHSPVATPMEPRRIRDSCGFHEQAIYSVDGVCLKWATASTAQHSNNPYAIATAKVSSALPTAIMSVGQSKVFMHVDDRTVITIGTARGADADDPGYQSDGRATGSADLPVNHNIRQ